MEYQKTIAKEAGCSGIALHTGGETTIVCKPALPDTGIRFIRTDLPGHPEIKASVQNVSDIVRGTNLGNGSGKIYTVEHLLATFVGFGIDNVIIEMNANEPPVGDGSALSFVDLVKQAGSTVQDVPKTPFILKETFLVKDNSSIIIAVPSDCFKISCTISYDHPEVKSQYITLDIGEETFINDIAPARTFCFYHEVEKLMDQGLIKGGSLDNAVVIGEDSIFSKEKLRFSNEFVRHKVLDLLGDLSLIGRRIQAHIIAIKPGHNLNIKMAKLLYDHIKKKEKEKKTMMTLDSGNLLDVNEIMKVLPHRYPFLLVDRILELTDTKAVGLKNVTINENFFNGHFPGRPIMPGVLIVEAMAQVGGVLMLTKSENAGKIAFFMSMNNVKFRKTVLPGDQLRLTVELIKVRSKTGKLHGKAYVGNALVTEADLMFSLVDA